MPHTQNVYKFPYDPYPQQTKLMNELFETIENRKHGIFESPTGTGKSLSILCSVLSWILKNQEDEMYQLAQHKLKIQEAEKDVTNDSDWINAFDRKQKLTLKLADEIENLEKIKIINDRIRNIKLKKSKNDLIRSTKIDQVDVHVDDSLDEEFILNYDSNEDDYNDENLSKEGSITKVFYCSRTHSQLAQVLKELRKTSYSNEIVTCCLGSRQNLCINSSVNGLKSINYINEKCLDLQKKLTKDNDENSEPPKKRSKNSSSSCCNYRKPIKIAEFSHEIIRTTMDIEDLCNTGQDIGGCPFYSVRQTLNKAHLVLMPYQNLLNPATRLATQIELRNNIVIIDEAHNLADTISSVNSVKLTRAEIDTCLVQIDRYFKRYYRRMSNKNLWYVRQIITVLNNFKLFMDEHASTSKSMSCVDFLFKAFLDSFNLSKLLNFLDRSKLAFKLRGFVKQQKEQNEELVLHTKHEKPTLFRKVEQVNVEKYRDSPGTENLGNCLLVVNNFLSAIVHSLDGQILFDSVGMSLMFLVVDPGKYLTDIIEQCRSVIVIGGTMQPFTDFTDRLFKVAGCPTENIQTFTCDHIIDASRQMAVMTLGCGLDGKPLKFTFENRNNNEMINESGHLVKTVLSSCPNGAVIFFPSYSMMDTIIDVWKSCNIFAEIEKLKQIFIEPKNANQSDKLMHQYSSVAKSKRGGVLFAVIGAKLSEGINFGDELARIVIVFGVPYPQLRDPILQEKTKFIEQKYGSESAKIMYENLAMKAVNQAIGRAIRHKEDYAAVLLLDVRYANIANISKDIESRKGKLGLPHWMREAITIHSNADSVIANIKSFFDKKYI